MHFYFYSGLVYFYAILKLVNWVQIITLIQIKSGFFLYFQLIKSNKEILLLMFSSWMNKVFNYSRKIQFYLQCIYKN